MAHAGHGTAEGQPAGERWQGLAERAVAASRGHPTPDEIESLVAAIEAEPDPVDASDPRAPRLLIACCFLAAGLLRRSHDAEPLAILEREVALLTRAVARRGGFSDSFDAGVLTDAAAAHMRLRAARPDALHPDAIPTLAAARAQMPESDPNRGVVAFNLGELFLERRQPGDEGLARDAFAEAAALYGATGRVEQERDALAYLTRLAMPDGEKLAEGSDPSTLLDTARRVLTNVQASPSGDPDILLQWLRILSACRRPWPHGFGAAVIDLAGDARPLLADCAPASVGAALSLVADALYMAGRDATGPDRASLLAMSDPLAVEAAGLLQRGGAFDSSATAWIIAGNAVVAAEDPRRLPLSCDYFEAAIAAAQRAGDRDQEAQATRLVGTTAARLVAEFGLTHVRDRAAWRLERAVAVSAGDDRVRMLANLGSLLLASGGDDPALLNDARELLRTARAEASQECEASTVAYVDRLLQSLDDALAPHVDPLLGRYGDIARPVIDDDRFEFLAAHRRMLSLSRQARVVFVSGVVAGVVLAAAAAAWAATHPADARWAWTAAVAIAVLTGAVAVARRGRWRQLGLMHLEARLTVDALERLKQEPASEHQRAVDILSAHLATSAPFGMLLRQFDAEASARIHKSMGPVYPFQTGSMVTSIAIQGYGSVQAALAGLTPRVAPFVSVANPTMPLLSYQVPRLYLADGIWAHVVRRLLRDATLIVVYAIDMSEGLERELDLVRLHRKESRTIIIVDEVQHDPLPDEGTSLKAPPKPIDESLASLASFGATYDMRSGTWSDGHVGGLEHLGDVAMRLMN